MSENVKDVLERIQKKGKSPNRFSRKNFDSLMTAMINDPEFTEKVAVVKGGELKDVKDVAVSKGFRGFLRQVVEKAGIDSNESAVVMEPSFTVDNVDGLYDFVTAAIYEYMDAGNTFDLPPKEDFKGSIFLRQKEASSKVSEVKNPRSKESMGNWRSDKKPHKTLVAHSPCPSYLVTRERVGDA